MTRSSIRTSLLALCAAAVCTVASANPPSPRPLPRPPKPPPRLHGLSKVDNYKLCLSQDKVAAHYPQDHALGQACGCWVEWLCAIPAPLPTHRQPPKQPRLRAPIRHQARPAALPARRCPQQTAPASQVLTHAVASGYEPRSPVGAAFLGGGAKVP